MREIYAISKLSLSLTTTTAESFGRTVVEGCARGTSVVAYAHGAVSKTMSALYPSGLVQPKDTASLDRQVDRVLDGKC